MPTGLVGARLGRARRGGGDRGVRRLGFWWFDGLAATRVRYLAGIALPCDRRLLRALGNPAALALALGPAVAVALARVRDRRLWLLAGAALAAVVVANLSGLSKAEVERIWLPFCPWVLVLAAGLADRPERTEALEPAPIAATPDWSPLAGALLAAQVVVAVAVESFVKTPW